MRFLDAFHLFTRLAVLSSFTILALFAQLHVPAMLMFLAAFIPAAFSQRWKLHLPPNAWLAISLLVIVGALYGWFVVNERFYSVVYVFLYLIINKLWTGTRNRDYLQLYGLTFFIVLASAVSTASLFFAPLLLVYLFFILAALVAITVKGDAERTFRPRRAGRLGRIFRSRRRAEPPVILLVKGEEQLGRLFGKRYFDVNHARWLSFILIFLLFIGSGIFVAIPRVPGRNFLSHLGIEAGGITRSGFTDSVDFTDIGPIQTDPTIVMRAIPLRDWPMSGGRPEIDVLRMRGTSLDHFDGRRWEKSDRALGGSYLADRARLLPSLPFTGFRPNTSYYTTVQIQPTARGYLFGPDRPRQYLFDFEVNAHIDPHAQSVQTASWGDTMTYRVESGVLPRDWYDQSTAEQARIALLESGSSLLEVLGGEAFGEQSLRRSLARLREHQAFIEDVYLRLPDLPNMEVIRELAGEWAGEETDRLLIVRKIENRLRFGFGYSLDASFSSRPDHLSYFLTERREGHCEYFATAMAVMLRLKGIPARIVNGYATDEWVTGGGGYFLVRQEHAHSWVEVWFPGAGWISFDPTPSAGIGANRVPSTLYRRFSRALDTMRLIWYRSVIDFGPRDQAFLYGTVGRAIDMMPGIERILDGSVFRSKGSFAARRATLLGLISFTMLVLTTFLVWELVKLHRARRLLGDPNLTMGQVMAISSYLKLLEALQDILPRRPSQTPLEFSRSVVARRDDLRGLLPLTGAYYATRFNEREWSEDCSREARRLLRLVREERAGEGSSGRRRGGGDEIPL